METLMEPEVALPKKRTSRQQLADRAQQMIKIVEDNGGVLQIKQEKFDMIKIVRSHYSERVLSSKGWTLITLTAPAIPNVKMYGESYCFEGDNFNGNLGILTALSRVLNDTVDYMNQMYASPSLKSHLPGPEGSCNPLFRIADAWTAWVRDGRGK